MTRLGLTLALVLACSIPANAGIIQLIEVGLDGDTPGVIASDFGEDSLAFSDRTHEHNGAAFDDGDVLSTSGANVVPLPDYLVGGDHIQFANNARDNADYRATAIADTLTNWYLLIDNRLNGPAGDASSPNSTDPVLGGTLDWVTLGGWQRVSTGISPGGQSDYTGVDEGGDGSLNQFYSVYEYPIQTNVVTVFSNGIGGSNMISLVGTAIPEPTSVVMLAVGAAALLSVRRRR